MEKYEALNLLDNVPHVDKGTIDMLLMHSGGEKSIIEDIYGAFFADVDLMVTDINQSLDSQQEEGLRRHAHSLSGVAGSVGALRLKEIARIIENAIKSGNTELAFHLAPRIPEIYTTFKQEIKNYI